MNEKSCLLDATVYAILNKWFVQYDTFESIQWELLRGELLRHIGHDGSERGFHSQEIQDVLRTLDILVIRHELYPCLQIPPPAGTNKVGIIPIYTREAAPDIFAGKLTQNGGVLIVRKPTGIHHALSFDPKASSTAYDVQKNEHFLVEELDIVMFLEFIHDANKIGKSPNTCCKSMQPTV